MSPVHNNIWKVTVHLVESLLSGTFCLTVDSWCNPGWYESSGMHHSSSFYLFDWAKVRCLLV